MQSIRKGIAWAILLVATTTLFFCSFGLRPSDQLSILSYNVENLFDAKHDGTEYSSFVPGEAWNRSLYQEKRAKIVEVLEFLDADIIALQEIENEAVLLSIRELLGERNYSYYCVSNFPDSAIQLGLLSRFPIVELHAHSVAIDAEYGIRGILEAHIRYNERDIVFLVNHWKSQRDGERSRIIRREQANLVYSRSRVLHQRGKSEIVVLGDFNEDFTKSNGAFVPWLSWSGVGIPVIHDLREAGGILGEAGDQPRTSDMPLFYSPLSRVPEGSYWYDGSWEKIDGIFLSLVLLELFSVETQEFFSFAEMRTSKGAPRSWHRSPQYRGYSDHLPAYLVLRQRPPQ